MILSVQIHLKLPHRTARLTQVSWPSVPWKWEVDMNFMEDSENSAVYRSRTSKVNEQENRDGIESLPVVAYQKARQMLFTAKSRQVVATDDPNTDKSSGKLSKFLDFSVFAVPSYTVATLSLLLTNFSHFTPQIHLVSHC